MIAVAGLAAFVVVVFAISSRTSEASEAEGTGPVTNEPGGGTLKAFASPLAAASDAAWTRFVRLMATAKARTVGASGQLGIFGMGPRRLKDLGYVSASRKVTRNGRAHFEARWVPPYSLEGYLGDGALQYQTFRASMLDHGRRIGERHRQAIGKQLAGKRVTLSGLLGVAHLAGLRGLARWLASGADRARYPQTTAWFLKTTGVF